MRSISEIVAVSENTFRELGLCCQDIPDELFFRHYPDMWSIAQHLQHLIISLKSTTVAYTIPAWIIKLVGGVSGRDSQSYSELVERYRKKLEEGGKASGRYVPKPIPPTIGKEKMLTRWNICSVSYLDAIQKNWAEEKFDRFLAPHPLLGKITLRELCFFTIFHTSHHLNIIRSRISA